MEEYTVTEFNQMIKGVVGENINQTIKIVGEISNLKFSGPHTYLTLKDIGAQTTVVFWNDHKEYKNGNNVEIIGRVDYYQKTNNIQIIGRMISLKGIGSIHQYYEQLHKKYLEKGYFDNRKELPTIAKNIGVITSNGGAALQDFMYVLKNGAFNGTVYLYNSIVQGTNCPKSVSAGIDHFTTNLSTQPIDLLVITRGGGSIEDLMGFSDPLVLEAIYRCPIYTISAVGHEVDTMLSDLVACHRAPTPSIAGETVVRINHRNLVEVDRLEKVVGQHYHHIIEKLYAYKNSLLQSDQLLGDPMQEVLRKLDMFENRMNMAMDRKLNRYRTKLCSMLTDLETNDPKFLIDCGYALICDNHNTILRSADHIFGKHVHLIFGGNVYKVLINPI